MYKGTIIEQSLADKSILKQVVVEKTYQAEDWTLYDVRVREDQISLLSNSLADGPWYIHIWKEGGDDIKVIYKDNHIFDLKFSDASTWGDAVAYGKALRIPAEQLDFLID